MLTRTRSPRRPRPDRPPKRLYPMKWVVAALAATAVLLIGGPYFYFYVIEGSAPARLHLPPANGVIQGPLAAGPVSGNWVVVSTGSVAGYRVQELLFGQSHTAVGRTSKVSGGMVISGSEVTAADFSVDMSSVRSDQGARDAQFRGFIMRTADHPHASFHLTVPIRLGQVPQVGRPVSAPVVGDLTLRGVTRSISFTVNAERMSDSSLDINAEITIKFSDWHIPNPSFAVARVGSTGTLEVLLHLVRADAQGRPLQPVPKIAPTTTVYRPGSFTSGT